MPCGAAVQVGHLEVLGVLKDTKTTKSDSLGPGILVVHESNQPANPAVAAVRSWFSQEQMIQFFAFSVSFIYLDALLLIQVRSHFTFPTKQKEYTYHLQK